MGRGPTSVFWGREPLRHLQKTLAWWWPLEGFGVCRQPMAPCALLSWMGVNAHGAQVSRSGPPFQRQNMLVVQTVAGSVATRLGACRTSS